MGFRSEFGRPLIEWFSSAAHLTSDYELIPKQLFPHTLVSEFAGSFFFKQLPCQFHCLRELEPYRELISLQGLKIQNRGSFQREPLEECGA